MTPHSVVASERLVERVVERAAQAELRCPDPDARAVAQLIDTIEKVHDRDARIELPKPPPKSNVLPRYKVLDAIGDDARGPVRRADRTAQHKASLPTRIPTIASSRQRRTAPTSAAAA